MHVTVVGAGRMGGGIAQVSAMAGHDVVVRDVDEDRVSTGIERIEDTLAEGVTHGKVSEDERDAALDRIKGVVDLEDAVADADLVVEAVPEDMDLKQDVFTDVEAAAPADAVLGSNTSSLPVTELASILDDPSRAIGLHFFNPPHLMDLVEVVVAEQTSDATEDFATDYVDSLDKEAVVVRDTPGFATSRLGVALGLEAARMVEEGVASPSNIDAGMREGYNHPMGPLELTDLVGLDVRLDIAESLRDELGERFKPPQILKRKVRAGDLGKKTGTGFYEYDDNGNKTGPADY